MATNYFCKIKDYPGESKDKAHDKWIEVIEFSHTIEQEAGATRASSGGLTKGRGVHGAFRIVKYLDKSSPKLAQAASGGKHIGDVTIELAKAIGEKQVTYMKYVLTHATITCIKSSGSFSTERGTSAPIEEVLFGYNKIDWTYTEYDDTGAGKGSVDGSWNLGTGEKT
jgi:type VI secretion system secreted protein Hcp